ncbi:ATP-binding protein [Glutamicibacter soli]|uniref:ATP-binding protein n=1 Tax=Glutamicibacter soli TaxID=453836 RepID=UPI0023512C21|nr:ATP-binding protein [Glutamicibacter soli]
MLNILSAREHRGSTIITSQFDPEDWYKSLHDAVIAESILNRLVSKSEIIQLDGPNMRRYEYASTQGSVVER